MSDGMHVRVKAAFSEMESLLSLHGDTETGACGMCARLIASEVENMDRDSGFAGRDLAYMVEQAVAAAYRAGIAHERTRVRGRAAGASGMGTMTTNDLRTATIRAMARRCWLDDPWEFADRMTKPPMPTEERCPGPRQAGVSCVDGRIDGGPGCRGNGMPCSICNGTGFTLTNPSIAGTGRTTRMLFEALVALEVGCTVEIVAADRDHAEDLHARLGALRDRAGSPDRGTVRYGLRMSWASQGERTEREIDLRLVDHAVGHGGGEGGP